MPEKNKRDQLFDSGDIKEDKKNTKEKQV